MKEKKKPSEETTKLMVEGYRVNAEEDLKIAKDCEYLSCCDKEWCDSNCPTVEVAKDGSKG